MLWHCYGHKSNPETLGVLDFCAVRLWTDSRAFYQCSQMKGISSQIELTNLRHIIVHIHWSYSLLIYPYSPNACQCISVHPNGRLLYEASSQALQGTGGLDSEPDDTDALNIPLFYLFWYLYVSISMSFFCRPHHAATTCNNYV